MVSANAVTTFCSYTYVTIKKDALTGYLVRESSALNRMLLKARKLALKHLTHQNTKVASTKPLKLHPNSSEHWSILTGEHVLGCTIIIIVNGIFYFLAHLWQWQPIFKFQNLTESMPSFKVPRDKAKIDMLTVFKVLSVAQKWVKNWTGTPSVSSTIRCKHTSVLKTSTQYKNLHTEPNKNSYSRSRRWRGRRGDISISLHSTFWRIFSETRKRRKIKQCREIEKLGTLTNSIGKDL